MRYIVSIMAVAMLGVLALTACNSAEQKVSKSSSLAAASPASKAPADGIRRITVAELKGLFDKNEVFIVDVRNEPNYKAGHIKGAKLIPVADTLNHINELPKDKLIVTYCS
jgi:predicted sulfurtransferase